MRIQSSLLSSDVAVNRNIDKSDFDNIKLVAQNIEDVINVSNDLELGANSKLEIVSNNLGSVTFVANNIDAVRSIGLDMENINEIVPVLPEIVSVHNIRDSVVSVSNHTSGIDIVAQSISNVSELSDNIDNVNILVDFTDEIVIDANNILSIQLVANDLTLAGWSSITDAGLITDTVEVEAQDSSNIITVADNIDSVNTNALNISKITTVSNNINKISTVVDNIADIQNAEVNAISAIEHSQIAEEYAITATDKASQASISSETAIYHAGLANKWANELEDIPVTGTIGIDDEYSAYHWAKKAEAALGGNITLDSLYDVDTSGITDGGILRYDSTTGWKAYDFSANPKVGFSLTGSSISTGELAWNPEDGTLDIGLNNGSVLQVGQENVRLVRNSTNVTIPNGTVCMYDGTIGTSGRVKVKPFTGVKGTELYLYGVATQDITSGSDGYVTLDGKVRNINTTGSIAGETWNDGDVLWAKPNDSGKLTKIVPSINEIKVEVASVIKSHINGTLEIRLLPIDRNYSYSQTASDSLYVPLDNDFNLDLGGL